MRWRDRLQQLAGFMRARRGMASSLNDFMADATWAASVGSTKDACGNLGDFFSARRSGFKHFSICYGMPECNICIDLCKRLHFDTMNRARLFHQICFHFNLLAPPGIISTEISQPGDSELAALFFILSPQEPTYKLRKQFLSEAFSSKKSFVH